MKRTLAIILSLVMLFSVLPLTAYAAEADAAGTGETLLSGKTNSYCNFSVNTLGNNKGYQLDVKGDGNYLSVTKQYYPDNHTGESNAPWITYNSNITQIKFLGVWHLNHAFYSCSKYFTGRDDRLSDTGLKVIFDNYLHKIGSYAFYHSHITEMNLGDCYDLESIGTNAFEACDFDKLTLANVAIGESAFKDCKNLKTVTLRGPGCTVGKNAFAGCTNITDVYFAGSPSEFQAAVADGNECLKNAHITYGAKDQKPIKAEIYITYTEPKIGATPDYNVTLQPNEYCELQTNTFDGTGLDIMNRTTGQPANWAPFKADNTYRYYTYLIGKSTESYEYVFTKEDTKVFINGQRVEMYEDQHYRYPRKNTELQVDYLPTAQGPSCTVSFDKNGGSGSMDSVTVDQGSAYKLPACSFTAPANKQFKNWKIGSSYYRPNDTVTINSNTTVYAQWEDKTDVVNALNFTIDEPAVGAQMKTAVKNVDDTRPLVGGITWYDESDGGKRVTGTFESGHSYRASINVICIGNVKLATDGSGNITMSATINGKTATVTGGSNYAYVDYTFPALSGGSTPSSHTIRFNKNGGTGSMSPLTVAAENNYYIPECTITPPANQVFDYWYDSDSATKWYPGMWRPAREDVTYRAEWRNETTPIAEASATVTPPVANSKPNLKSTSGNSDLYSVSVAEGWYLSGTNQRIYSTARFENGKSYDALVTFTTQEPNSFDNKTKFRINGMVAEVTSLDTFTAQAKVTFVAGDSAGFTVSGSFTSYLNAADSVVIQLMQGDDMKYSTTVTGNTGSYSIPNVASGSYTLRVSKNNHVTRDYTVNVSGNKTQDVQINPLGDADLNGKVQAADAMKAYQHAQGKANAQLSGYAFDCADMAPVGSPNGKVQAADAMVIYQQAQGKHSLF